MRTFKHYIMVISIKHYIFVAVFVILIRLLGQSSIKKEGKKEGKKGNCIYNSISNLYGYIAYNGLYHTILF